MTSIDLSGLVPDVQKEERYVRFAGRVDNVPNRFELVRRGGSYGSAYGLVDWRDSIAYGRSTESRSGALAVPSPALTLENSRQWSSGLQITFPSSARRGIFSGTDLHPLFAI